MQTVAEGLLADVQRLYAEMEKAPKARRSIWVGPIRQASDAYKRATHDDDEGARRVNVGESELETPRRRSA